MSGPDEQRSPGDGRTSEEQQARALGVALFNATWDLLDAESRTPEDDDTMLHRAHASRYHWGQARPAPANLSRGEWLCSRVYAVLGRPEPCLHHARRTMEICERHGLGDFDLAFAFEALARAHALAGDRDRARLLVEQARDAATEVAGDEDRALVLADLETIHLDPAAPAGRDPS